MNEDRARALSPHAMILRGQMDGPGGTVEEWVWFFCSRVDYWKLKPWGRIGRKFVGDAINRIAEDGGYEGLHSCANCRGERWIVARETITLRYDDGFIESQIGRRRALLAAGHEGAEVWNDDVIAARVDSYRRELVSRQKSVVRTFDVGEIDELVQTWRSDGEIELWCEACKTRAAKHDVHGA